jgi:hypothetical protein
VYRVLEDKPPKTGHKVLKSRVLRVDLAIASQHRIMIFACPVAAQRRLLPFASK